jgi:hypothetical protein
VRVGWLNSPAGHEWLIRRCVEFGVASSRYEKRKNATLKAEKKKS